MPLVKRANTITNKNKKNVFSKLKDILFSSQGFPIFLTCTVLAMLFVLFRMKAIELDYEMTSLNKNIKEVQNDSKQLKARKARLLSVKRLRALAKKYDLRQPKQEQIIVIP